MQPTRFIHILNEIELPFRRQIRTCLCLSACLFWMFPIFNHWKCVIRNWLWNEMEHVNWVHWAWLTNVINNNDWMKFVVCDTHLEPAPVKHFLNHKKSSIYSLFRLNKTLLFSSIHFQHFFNAIFFSNSKLIQIKYIFGFTIHGHEDPIQYQLLLWNVSVSFL